MKKKKNYQWMAFGAAICGLYVLLGAFGAHGLEGKISADDQHTFATALRYLSFHGIALIVVNLMALHLNKNVRAVNLSFLMGLLFFSVSLMIHATKSLLGFDLNAFALIAPIGGLAFIIGWILLTISIIKK